MSNPTDFLTDLQKIHVTWSIQGGYEWTVRDRKVTIDRAMVDFLLATWHDEHTIPPPPHPAQATFPF